MTLAPADGDDPIREIARLQIPGELIQGADLTEVLARIGGCLEQLQRQQDKRAEHDNAGLFGKIGNWFTGNTGRSRADLVQSLDVQTELLKGQMVIGALNVSFAKRIAEQQQVIGEQQRRLEHQNVEIRANQVELGRQNDEIRRQQETILKLVTLTGEHEKKIRDTVKLATDIVDLEARLRAEAERQVKLAQDALSASIDEMRTSVATEATAIHENLDALRESSVRELEAARSDMRTGLVELGESLTSRSRETAEAIEGVAGDLVRERTNREEALLRVDGALRDVRARARTAVAVAWAAVAVAVVGLVAAFVVQ